MRKAWRTCIAEILLVSCLLGGGGLLSLPQGTKLNRSHYCPHSDIASATAATLLVGLATDNGTMLTGYDRRKGSL